MGLAWALLTRRGAAWTDAKLLVITSPVVVLLAWVGVESLRRAGHRVEGALVGGAIALGVLASNAFTYHDTNLQPTGRYKELIDIGERSRGAGAHTHAGVRRVRLLCAPGYGCRRARVRVEDRADSTPQRWQPVGLRPFIRPRPAPARERPRLRGDRGSPPPRREPATRLLQASLSVDAATTSGSEESQWPCSAMSRPASGFTRPETSPADACARLRRRRKREHAQLRFVERPDVVAVDATRLQRLARPAGWPDSPDGIVLCTPGTMDVRVDVPESGRYRVWLRGDFGRAVAVAVNGQPLGEVSYESGNEGNYALPLSVDLEQGRHRLTISRGGGSLAPGDGTPSKLVGVVFEPAEPPPRRPRCKRARLSLARAMQPRVDWVEAVRPLLTAAARSRSRSASRSPASTCRAATSHDARLDERRARPASAAASGARRRAGARARRRARPGRPRRATAPARARSPPRCCRRRGPRTAARRPSSPGGSASSS